MKRLTISIQLLPWQITMKRIIGCRAEIEIYNRSTVYSVRLKRCSDRVQFVITRVIRCRVKTYNTWSLNAFIDTTKGFVIRQKTSNIEDDLFNYFSFLDIFLLKAKELFEKFRYNKIENLQIFKTYIYLNIYLFLYL